MFDERAPLLRAALGFASLAPREPELRVLHRWLDTWSGVGHVVAGMARQGYDLELRRYDGQYAPRRGARGLAPGARARGRRWSGRSGLTASHAGRRSSRYGGFARRTSHTFFRSAPSGVSDFRAARTPAVVG